MITRFLLPITLFLVMLWTKFMVLNLPSFEVGRLQALRALRFC